MAAEDTKKVLDTTHTNGVGVSEWLYLQWLAVAASAYLFATSVFFPDNSILKSEFQLTGLTVQVPLLGALLLSLAFAYWRYACRFYAAVKAKVKNEIYAENSAEKKVVDRVTSRRKAGIPNDPNDLREREQTKRKVNALTKETGKGLWNSDGVNTTSILQANGRLRDNINAAISTKVTQYYLSLSSIPKIDSVKNAVIHSMKEKSVTLDDVTDALMHKTIASVNKNQEKNDPVNQAITAKREAILKKVKASEKCTPAEIAIKNQPKKWKKEMSHRLKNNVLTNTVVTECMNTLNSEVDEAIANKVSSLNDKIKDKVTHLMRQEAVIASDVTNDLLSRAVLLAIIRHAVEQKLKPTEANHHKIKLATRYIVESVKTVKEVTDVVVTEAINQVEICATIADKVHEKIWTKDIADAATRINERNEKPGDVTLVKNAHIKMEIANYDAQRLLANDEKKLQQEKQGVVKSTLLFWTPYKPSLLLTPANVTDKLINIAVASR